MHHVEVTYRSAIFKIFRELHDEARAHVLKAISKRFPCGNVHVQHHDSQACNCFIQSLDLLRAFSCRGQQKEKKTRIFKNGVRNHVTVSIVYSHSEYVNQCPKLPWSVLRCSVCVCVCVPITQTTWADPLDRQSTIRTCSASPRSESLTFWAYNDQRESSTGTSFR